MASLRSTAILDHSADAVWAVIRDTGGIAEWFPAMVSSEAREGGRVVTLGDGTVIDEDIVTLDDRLRRLQYRVIGGDLAVESHLGTVDVIELPDGRSVLVYGTDIEPADVAAAFDAAIAEAVAGLNTHLQG